MKRVTRNRTRTDSANRLALFDDTHGQPNWSQTGFPSRELDADCSGLAEVLRDMGYDCAGVRPRLLSDRLSHPCLLVVPPPTGYYNPARQTWQPLTSSLFTPAEVRDIRTRSQDIRGWARVWAHSEFERRQTGQPGAAGLGQALRTYRESTKGPAGL